MQHSAHEKLLLSFGYTIFLWLFLDCNRDANIRWWENSLMIENRFSINGYSLLVGDCVTQEKSQITDSNWYSGGFYVLRDSSVSSFSRLLHPSSPHFTHFLFIHSLFPCQQTTRLQLKKWFSLCFVFVGQFWWQSQKVYPWRIRTFHMKFIFYILHIYRSWS